MLYSLNTLPKYSTLEYKQYKYTLNMYCKSIMKNIQNKWKKDNCIYAYNQR